MKHQSHHAKRHQHSAVLSPEESDCTKVMALLAVGAIIILSLFALEHVAGVPVSVRGQVIYNALPTPTTRRTTANKSSLTTQRRAERLSRLPSANSPASPAACADSGCRNMIATFAQGDPMCMKLQQCVNALYVIIARPDCVSTASCRTLNALYSFFISSQSCINQSTIACQNQARAIIQYSQKL